MNRMSQDNPDKSIEFLGDGTPVRSEAVGFASGQMTACTACVRQNPPDRENCLYCGRSLEVPPEYADRIKSNVRRLEDWENGFNIIVGSETLPPQSELTRIAELVGAAPADIEVAISTKQDLPIARVESRRDADKLAAAIAGSDIRVSIIADTGLFADRLPTRLRAIEFGDGEITFIDFNRSARTTLAKADIKLLVTGTVNENKTDRLEKKGRRGRTKLLDESETSSDESVLDIYSCLDPLGFRIMLTGFDFSCLGQDRGLLATENMRLLVTVLHDVVSDARLISDYAAVRHALSPVWDIDRRQDSKGMQRSGFAKQDFANTASSSNLRQFNRYSRLQWHLV